ncbi:MAG: chromosomal replication initiator protein DnaA [Candidatus Woesearchaeota archaeon]
MDKKELWQKVLAQIQNKISSANFATWFKKTEIISKENKSITIAVPNSFAKEWLKNKYNNKIEEILENLEVDIKNINYTIKKTSNNETKNDRNETTEEELVGQLDFQEFKKDKDTNLNSKYTFNNFVVGPFNELSHAAASAVSKNPGSVYNPLFIYGGVGLGKTHLLQAIGNEVRKKFPRKKIKYISSEKFTSEVVSSIRNQKMEDLKSKYRTIDVLILDDVQFLAGKEKTQEEFFHIFNTLYEKNKQIIISSDRSPKSISALTERLRSRFEGGMIADISYPDYETRVAILKTKSKEKNLSFSEETLDYIAINIKKNIRELEGALNKLSVYKNLNNKELNIEKTKSILQNFVQSSRKKITPQKVIDVVIDFYDVNKNNVLSSCRRKEIVKPRQIAMYLLKKELELSYPSIGKKLGGKDHTTAIYAYKKISKKIEEDDNLEGEISLLKQKLASA